MAFEKINSLVPLYPKRSFLFTGPTSTWILRLHHLWSVVMVMAVMDGHHFPFLPPVLQWQLVSAVASISSFSSCFLELLQPSLETFSDQEMKKMTKMTIRGINKEAYVVICLIPYIVKYTILYKNNDRRRQFVNLEISI